VIIFAESDRVASSVPTEQIPNLHVRFSDLVPENGHSAIASSCRLAPAALRPCTNPLRGIGAAGG
jgi:hypothetical protein